LTEDALNDLEKVMKENRKEIEDIKFNVNKQQDFIMNFKATNYNF